MAKDWELERLHFDYRTLQELNRESGEPVAALARSVYNFSFCADLPQEVHEAIRGYLMANGREPRYLLLGLRQYEYLRLEFSRDRYAVLYREEYEGEARVRETFMGIEILKVNRVSFIEVTG